MPLPLSEILRHLARVLPWLPAPSAPPARTRPAPHDEEPPDDRPLGCGWFDSSHELQAGLQVREADEGALATLPLGDWLALELREWTGQPRPEDDDAGIMLA